MTDTTAPAAVPPAVTPESGSPELVQLLADLNSAIPPLRQGVASAQDIKRLEELRIEIMGKKGKFAEFNTRMGALSPTEKPIAGKMINHFRGDITLLLKSRTEEIEAKALDARLSAESLDVTLPGLRPARGSLHPITLVTNDVLAIFRSMGFRVESGPEIESEYLNFDALNMPMEHPARDMQDTFYTERGFVLRTHTSPTQIRSMLKLKAPLAVVTTGKVYRHDSDATHSPMFHQMEGLLVDENVSFGHLKGVLMEFLRALYGPDVKVRLRPSFFPFTEPSAEVDVWSDALGRWLEVLGSGMVHPNVLRSGGVDPAKYSGFAFGLGLDRLATIRYKIPDLRLLFENDVRFLRQF